MKPTSNVALLIITYCLPLSLVILSIPLILKWIPPNHFYGFRMKPAFDSNDAWYRANIIGGWYMGAAGILSLLINVLVFRRIIANMQHQLFTMVISNSIILGIAILLSIVHVRQGH